MTLCFMPIMILAAFEIVKPSIFLGIIEQGELYNLAICS